MPDSNLADNGVLTSAFYNTYIRQQVVVTCTSGTRPTAVEGRLIFETDTNLLRVHDGSTWRAISNTAGRITVAGTQIGSTDGSGDITISFGVTFSAAPIVVCTPQIGSTTQIAVHYPSSATTTQQVVRVTSNDAVLASTSVTIRWIAAGTI